MVYLKLGGPPHLLQFKRTNQERFVADWEAIVLEVAFVWPPGPKTSGLIEGPAKVLLATGRKRSRLLTRSPSTSGRQR